ncbi:MAG: TIGR02652 family protein [Leptolyngbya sp. LCM1.Bin17]|nr:MAG: TIGR02652 family protein [Leptolyngbya sp. LCM1.Bin17]
MSHPAIDYPAFGPEIQCPHCHRTISALFLTDTYLCPRHGAFEVSTTGELVHGSSGRCWHHWEDHWYRQHIHLEGLRQDLGWSPDGQHLAVSARQQVYLWAVPQWKRPKYQWELMATSLRLQWSPEGAYLASANQDNSVGVLTWSNVHRLRQTPTDPADLPTLLQGFPGKVRQLAWADIPDADKSPILAAATRDLVVMGVLVPDEDWQSWLLDLHNGPVLDVAFQPETGLLASLSQDGWIILWKAAVEAAQILEGVKGGFSALAWHPEGQHLAAEGQQGEVLVWSVV